MAAYITGGKVNFERRVTTGQYEHKSASIEFSVAAEEGSDASAVVEQAANLAHSQVHRLLNIPEPKLGNMPSVATLLAARDVLQNPDPAPAQVDPDKPRRGRPPKPPTPAAPADPAAMEPAQGDIETVIEQTKTGSQEPDPAAFETETAGEVPEVTDVDLAQAASKKQSEIGDAQAIKKLIGRYVEQDGKPHFLREIPQANRQAFLMELKTLVKL